MSNSAINMNITLRKGPEVHHLKLRTDGRIEFLNPPPFKVVVASKRRFSEIVPVDMRLRIPFRLLRFLFGERGKVSDWTRGWRCAWRATILMGKYKGYYAESRHRDRLIEWERSHWFEPHCDL